MTRYFLAAGFWLLGSTLVCAQNTITSGLLLSLNTSFQLSEKWKLNTKIETRQTAVTGDYDDLDWGFIHDRLDAAAIITRQLGSRTSVSAGYLVRIHDTSPAHRFLQQYAFSSGYGSISVAHRIAADQTHRSHDATEFRLRYRLTIEIPLNGQAVNNKEFYLKLGNEYLGILQSRNTDLEIRATGAFGFSLTDNTKLEAGIDYRLQDIIPDGTGQQFWLTLGAFLSL